MAGKHIGAGAVSSSLGSNYIPGGKIDKAYAEGRLSGGIGRTNGIDNTSTAAATMTDSTAAFPTAGIGLDGRVITNLTNGSVAVITANTATVVTGTLSGSETWDSGDGYSISGGLLTDNPHDGLSNDAELAWDAGFLNQGVASAKHATATA